MSQRLPRIIKPEHIERGDIIAATRRDNQGISTTTRGRVDRIEHVAVSGKEFWTREGGCIVMYYDRDLGKQYTFTLFERAPVPDGPGLF